MCRRVRPTFNASCTALTIVQIQSLRSQTIGNTPFRKAYVSKLENEAESLSRINNFNLCQKCKQRWQRMLNLYCAVANCSNRSDKQHNIPYHIFLKDKSLCERWEKALAKEDSAFCEVKRRFVCGEHFLPSTN